MLRILRIQIRNTVLTSVAEPLRNRFRFRLLIFLHTVPVNYIILIQFIRYIYINFFHSDFYSNCYRKRLILTYCRTVFLFCFSDTFKSNLSNPYLRPFIMHGTAAGTGAYHKIKVPVPVPIVEKLYGSGSSSDSATLALTSSRRGLRPC